MRPASNSGVVSQYQGTLASKYLYQPLSGPLKAVGPARRGYLRLTAILALGAATPTLLAPVFGFAAVYNYQRPSVLLAVVLLLGCWLLIGALPQPSTVLFSALLTAGLLANTIGAQWAPVADYFLVPGSVDHYFNLADILIVGAIPCGAVLLFRIINIVFSR